MKVLVTGGAGFIGSHVVDAFLGSGHQVVVVDRMSREAVFLNPEAMIYKMDVRSPEVEAVFEKERPEVLVHLAAQTDASLSIGSPSLDADINVLGTINVLEAAARNGVKRVVFSSSGGAAYGHVPGDPATESSPVYPETPYGVSKLAGEMYLDHYRRMRGLFCIALRYSNVYGPRQTPQGESGVVPIFIKAMLSGHSPTINSCRTVGDGGCILDYVYVKDVADANLRSALLDQGEGEGQILGDTFNISSGVGTKTDDLFYRIAALLNFKEPPLNGPPRPGDAPRSVLSNLRARGFLGWTPRYSLYDGLKETVEWFRAGVEI